MIEINLFEKKEKNILPYVILVTFIIGVLILFGTYYTMAQNYERVDRNNEQWLTDNAGEVALSRQIENVNRLVDQNNRAIEQLEAQDYPIVFLTENITSIIPKEEERVVTFRLTQGDSLSLHLVGMGVDETSDLIAEFEEVPYIDRVNVTQFIETDNENELYQLDMSLEINEDQLREEALLWE